MDGEKIKNPTTDQKRVLLFWNGLASSIPKHRQCLREILEDAAFQHRCSTKDLAIGGYRDKSTFHSETKNS